MRDRIPVLSLPRVRTSEKPMNLFFPASVLDSRFRGNDKVQRSFSEPHEKAVWTKNNTFLLSFPRKRESILKRFLFVGTRFIASLRRIASPFFPRSLKGFLPIAVLLGGLAANGSGKAEDVQRPALSFVPETSTRKSKGAQPPPWGFVDFPVMARSGLGSAGDTRLRFGAGARGGLWPHWWGNWRLGFDASGVLLAPLADGSPRVFVTPYTVELTGRGLIGYAARNGRIAFVPYGFVGGVGQLTLVHLRTFTRDAFGFDGDIAAVLGPGLAVHIGGWLVRLDLGVGYGLHGLLWQTTLGIGMGQTRG
ncbi:MAG: hypothetical protein AAF471_00560 [Myxococcota bacterium]